MELDFMGELDQLVLHTIVSKVGAKKAAQLSILCKGLRDAASDDRLWASFCSHDLNISQPIDPLGNPCTSFKETYQTWHEAFGMYPLPLVKRVKLCWDTIKNWASTNLPDLLHTFRKGASEAELDQAEDRIGVKFPIPTRIIYRFVNGQRIRSSVESFYWGIIGGYHFYQHRINVRLLPLSDVVERTLHLSRLLLRGGKTGYVLIAASCRANKFFLLNCSSGQLYVGTKYFETSAEMMPCVPGELIRLENEVDAAEHQDGLLLWLEEHARRLGNGAIGVREEIKIRSINLFPETHPCCSTAVTNGVQVRASAIFIPELSSPEDVGQKYVFSYSIRMQLVSQGRTNFTPFSSCQLYWRHWVIRAGENIISEVHDEAVIGQYPLLQVGGKEFVYESCTYQPSVSGSIEGSFTFRPGSLANPIGEDFEVQVARFPMDIPHYIF